MSQHWEEDNGHEDCLWYILFPLSKMLMTLFSFFRSQILPVAGAGSAGLGVCLQLVDGMVREGMTREEAMSRFVIVTSLGALGRANGGLGDPNLSRGLVEERLPWVNAAVAGYNLCLCRRSP